MKGEEEDAVSLDEFLSHSKSGIAGMPSGGLQSPYDEGLWSLWVLCTAGNTVQISSCLLVLTFLVSICTTMP